MSGAVGIHDLPEADPGLPRFVLLVALLAVGGAAVAAVRGSPTGPGPGTGAVAEGRSPEAIGWSGEELFLREGCGECHAADGSSSALGPGLAGALGRASERIADPTYGGTARSPREYLWEATVDHCRDPLPGYACPEGVVVGLRLGADEVDRVVDYVVQLGERAP